MNTVTPLLTEGGTRIDWRDGSYTPTVAITAGGVEVEHRLRGADTLVEAVANGSAVYTLEMRGPAAWWSVLHKTDSATQMVTIDINLAAVTNLFVIPGIAAVKDFRLNGSELADAFTDGIDIPQGVWLARGQPRSVETVSASLIRFRRDDEEQLSNGTMAAHERVVGGRPVLMVTLACDLFDHRREERDIQVAGLIAACALLPRSSLAAGGANAEHPLATRIRARLADLGIPDWDDPMFDAGLTATLLEPFTVSAPKISSS